MLALAVVYSMLAINAIQPVFSSDVWWHLRTGEWIVEHRAVPRTDIFSISGQGRPYVAYSWLYEVLLFGSYRALGQWGLIVFTQATSIAATLAVHRLIRTFRPRFSVELALLVVWIGAIRPLLTPRAWFFSMIAFTIELGILLRARSTGRMGPLWALPLVFACWANVHIQFVHGLFAFVLAALEAPIGKLLGRRGARIGIQPSVIVPVLVASAFATLVTPYHLDLYRAVSASFHTKGQFDYVSELAAPTFRFLSEWLVLGVILVAAAALGYRRERSPFVILLFATTVFLSFAAAHDVWFGMIVSMVIVAGTEWPHAGRRIFLATGPLEATAVAAGVAGAIVATAWSADLSESKLEIELAQRLPVGAVRFIEQHHYEGPLYNHVDWGGYLIWRLRRLPVSLDGRTYLHGDARMWRSVKTWNGMPGWETDPDLVAARLVVAPVGYPLTELLRRHGRFDLLYEDQVAAVFVRR